MFTYTKAGALAIVTRTGSWDRSAPAMPISHDRPCMRCGHSLHTYLPCSDSCACAAPDSELITEPDRELLVVH